MMTLDQPTIAEIQAAAKASGEFDSDQQFDGYGKYQRACAGCGEKEEDDGDAGRYGQPISVHSESLTECREDCDCLAHPHCLKDGKCPHCVTLDSLDVARDLVRICGLSLEQAFAQIATADRRLAGVSE